MFVTGMKLGYFLYVYDCMRSRHRNARRIAFTKELYGVVYRWKTKTGMKEKRKPGLIEQCQGSRPVSESVILVPEEHRGSFDTLFKRYEDILVLHVFQVTED